MTTRDIHAVFVDKGYTWSYKDEPNRTPTEDEIEAVIAQAHRALAQESDGTQVEVGRLIVRRAEGFIDTYVHLDERRLDGLG